MTGVNGIKIIEKQEVILLIDSTIKINKIKHIIENEKILKIISFDLESHRSLNKKEIIHDVSDLFLNDTIRRNIQKECYRLVEWYNVTDVKNNLKIEGINIPKLFSDQFISSLIKFLKIFTEIQIIYNKFPNLKFIVSNELFQILNNFTNNLEEINQRSRSEEFYFDNIETGLKIGGKYLNLKISKNNYNKIKSVVEKLLQFSVGTKKDDKNIKSTLIVEFNTENFESLFVEGNKHGEKFLFYGIRRPTIWNKKTYNIIKNSGCKVIMPSKLLDHEIYTEISEITVMFKEKFLQILNYNCVKDFFSINNISILPLLKNKICDLIVKNLEHVIIEIFQAKYLFKKYSISSVLVISEAGRTEQIITKFAKDLQIPILHLQEGLHFDTTEAQDNVKSQGVFPELADKYIVWGEIYKIDALKNGKVDPTKIKSIGSPRFKNLLFDPTQNQEKYVLFATVPPQIEEVNGLNVLNLEKYTESILKICEIISKHGEKLIIKLHPTFDVLKIPEIIEKQFPEVQVISKGDINPLIRSCSKVIVTGLSTVILQSQILQKPVIVIPIIEYNWGIPTIYKNKSCIVSTVDDLNDELLKLKDQHYKDDLIERGNKFVDICLTNKNSASEKLWKYIQELTS